MYLLAFFKAIKTVWMSRRYRPELHYMRGPGPKWREKHDWAVIDGPSPAVTKALMAGLRP